MGGVGVRSLRKSGAVALFGVWGGGGVGVRSLWSVWGMEVSDLCDVVKWCRCLRREVVVLREAYEAVSWCQCLDFWGVRSRVMGGW